MIPYFLFELIYVFMGSFADGDKYTWVAFINSIFIPISHFWFIYVLFFVYVIVPPLLSLVKNEGYAIAIFLIIAFLMRDVFHLEWEFPLEKIVYYSAFFCAGKLYSKNFKIIRPETIVCSAFAYIILISIQITEIKYSSNVWYNTIISICAIVFLMGIFQRIKGKDCISDLGKRTMPIYLIHSLFVSILRSVLRKVGIDNFDIIILLTCVVGILGPWLIEKMSNVVPIINMAFYPRKYIKAIGKKCHR